MSLTEILAIPEVAAQFNKYVRLPSQATRSSTPTSPLVPCPHQSYALVGTAFDYCMRFCLVAANQGIVREQPWIAEIALEVMKAEEEQLPSGVSLSQAHKGVGHARELYQTFLQNKVFTRKLARASLFLAALDRAYRNGPAAISSSHLKDTLGAETDDLMRLVNAIPRDLLKAHHRVILNPNFGRASELVGGADADYIIDDTLVDIKTTKACDVTPSHLHQLVGYHILITECESETITTNDIKACGIYFSRHAYLTRFFLKDMIDRESLMLLRNYLFSKARAIMG